MRMEDESNLRAIASEFSPQCLGISEVGEEHWLTENGQPVAHVLIAPLFS